LNSRLYLLDTNTVSYSIKGGHPRVWARLQQIPPERVAISAITEAELRYWVVDRPQEANTRVLVDAFLSRVASLPWDSSATRAYAQLRADCKRAGKALAELDMQIAAHAIALQAILVTHDSAFSHISGLLTEDWV
jgi:tRNA(fMet)-specific endonuclease VapC